MDSLDDSVQRHPSAVVALLFCPFIFDTDGLCDTNYNFATHVAYKTAATLTTPLDWGICIAQHFAGSIAHSTS